MADKEVVVEETEVIEEIETTTTADPTYQLDPATAARLLAGDGANAGLINALQGKLDGMIGKPSGYIETLPKPLRNRIAYLGELQDQHDDLEEKLHEEQVALHRKYEALWKPLFEKRAAIVQGKQEAPQVQASEEEEQADDNEDEAGDVPAGIPDFWLAVLQSHKELSETLEDKDLPILSHLIDLQVVMLRDEEPTSSTKSEDEDEDGDDGPKVFLTEEIPVLLQTSTGFKLVFTFSENSFFTNKQLVKTYYMASDDDDTSPVLQKAVGTNIDWASGKNPGVKIQKKKASGKGKKPSVRSSKVATFFDFFSPPVVPDSEDELTQEQMEDLQENLERDYELGEVLKDDVIPYAIKWFTGEAQMEDSDEEYGDEDEEDEEEDDEDDEDESPIRQGKAAKKTGKAAPKGAAESKETPPDCKQQ